MRLNSKKEKLKDRLIGVGVCLLGIVLIFGVPFVINESYKYGEVVDGYSTLLSASDCLQYYGILLGAAAAIFAVVQTINHSKKSERNRAGVDIAFKLIEACELNKLYDVIREIAVLKSDMKDEYIEKIANVEIMNISLGIDLNFKKLQFIYPEMKENEKTSIIDFFSPYNSLVIEIAQDLKISPDKKIILNEKKMSEIQSLYDNKHADISEKLQNLISSYA